jgi:hypothetical protein
MTRMDALMSRAGREARLRAAANKKKALHGLFYVCVFFIGAER